MQYICFFHPRITGDGPKDCCTACGRSFAFPSLNPPAEIAGFDVEGELGRGFYAAAYRVRDRRTGIASVIKVTPKAVYEFADPLDDTKGGYGNRRDFESECRVHVSLSDLPEVARISNWGEDSTQFGPEAIPVYWMQMELVRGETLESYFERGPVLSPRSIAQVAEDLLSLSEKLQALGIFHNDLHGGNAALVELPPERHRRRAIDPTIAVRVFDLGSASRDDKADVKGTRLGDLEQVSLQIHRLLDRFDQDHHSVAIASDVRLSAGLRRIAQAYSQADWRSRRASASDMLQEVRNAYATAIHPERVRAVELHSVQDHYNAQTLPSSFARTLIYDPEGKWASAMASAGPQLVVGMRGCGKTMLLRSLEWAAHAVVNPGEDILRASARLRDLSYVGLFVSCAYLLRAPRERVGKGALQRLYLAYALEAIRAAQVCEAMELGEVQPEAMDWFNELVSATVPTYDSGTGSRSLPLIELELSKAIQRDVPEDTQRAFVPLEAFTQLAKSVRRMVDIWAGKTVLFLLDDASKRFVNEEDLADLLTEFCLKSEAFGFKISTETQTLVLHSPSGERALEGRDYQVFNLGAEVLEELKGAEGTRFLGRILDQRQRLISGSAAAPALRRLGNRSLNSIADGIRSADGDGVRSTSDEDVAPYFGLRALAAVCVGDIGDVLQIFHRMTTGLSPAALVDPRRQHEVLEDESRLRLLSQVKLDVNSAWFFEHCTAFATASHRELINRDRRRQYSDMFVEIDAGDRSGFRMLMDLVDNGVYVVIGFRQRTKASDGRPIYQFALRFRKLFGLFYRVPLSNRDRFELTGSAVQEWLSTPTSSQLTNLESGQVALSRGLAFSRAIDLDEDESDASEAIEKDEAGVAQDVAPADDRLFDDEFLAPAAVAPGPLRARTARSVSIDEVPLGPDVVDWASATVLVGGGFEDRAVGSLEALESGRVSRVGCFRVLRYADPGRLEDVGAVAGRLSKKVEYVDVDAYKDPSVAVDAIIGELADGPVVLDVSALTKPLAFCFVRGLLEVRKQLFVVHTSAANYEPTSGELEPVMALLDSGAFAEGLRQLDEVTPGEGMTFTPVLIGAPSLDASLRSVLISFVTLKYRRLDALLESISTDKLVGVRTTHSSRPKGVESRAVQLISDYLVASRNGELRAIGAMDASATYDLLMEYYDQYVLDDVFRLELALTGTKMQTVGAGAFAAIGHVSSVFYSVPLDRDTGRFTHGTGRTRLYSLRSVLSH